MDPHVVLSTHLPPARNAPSATAPMTPRDPFFPRRQFVTRTVLATAIAVFGCLAGLARLSAEDSLPDYVISVWGTEHGLKPGDVFAMAGGHTSLVADFRRRLAQVLF